MGTVRIPLTQGKYALIDEADTDLVLPHQWSAHQSAGGYWYAISWIDGAGVRMHRLIVGALPGELVDHKDGDGLNNRRSNIRRCTKADNANNSGPRAGSRSGLKGVCLRSDGKGWQARIRSGQQQLHLGSFPTAELAARAYDDAARRLHGEFAWLNFPQEGEVGARLIPAEDPEPEVVTAVRHHILRTNSSGYRGVRLDRRRGRWQAQIEVGGRNRSLGYFGRPEDAARAYDIAAYAARGDAAILNFPGRRVIAKGSIDETGVGSVPAIPCWESDPTEYGELARLDRADDGRVFLSWTDMEEHDGAYVSIEVSPGDLRSLRDCIGAALGATEAPVDADGA